MMQMTAQSSERTHFKSYAAASSEMRDGAIPSIITILDLGSAHPDNIIAVTNLMFDFNLLSKHK